MTTNSDLHIPNSSYVDSILYPGLIKSFSPYVKTGLANNNVELTTEGLPNTCNDIDAKCKWNDIVKYIDEWPPEYYGIDEVNAAIVRCYLIHFVNYIYEIIELKEGDDVLDKFGLKLDYISSEHGGTRMRFFEAIQYKKGDDIKKHGPLLLFKYEGISYLIAFLSSILRKMKEDIAYSQELASRSARSAVSATPPAMPSEPKTNSNPQMQVPRQFELIMNIEPLSVRFREAYANIGNKYEGIYHLPTTETESAGNNANYLSTIILQRFTTLDSPFFQSVQTLVSYILSYKVSFNRITVQSLEFINGSAMGAVFRAARSTVNETQQYFQGDSKSTIILKNVACKYVLDIIGNILHNTSNISRFVNSVDLLFEAINQQISRDKQQILGIVKTQTMFFLKPKTKNETELMTPVGMVSIVGGLNVLEFLQTIPFGEYNAAPTSQSVTQTQPRRSWIRNPFSGGGTRKMKSKRGKTRSRYRRT